LHHALETASGNGSNDSRHHLMMMMMMMMMMMKLHTRFRHGIWLRVTQMHNEAMLPHSSTKQNKFRGP
jgi:hypothetical protein